VEFEDRREKLLDEISEEEIASIRSTFQEYDIDGSGGISKDEMLKLVRKRSQDRKDLIEQKFEDYVAAEQEELQRLQMELEKCRSQRVSAQKVNCSNLVL